LAPPPAGARLLRNSLGLRQRDKFEAHRFSSCAKLGFLTLLITDLIGGELAVIEFLTRRYQVKDDAGQLVRSCGDGFWSAEFGAHPSIEIAERTLAVIQRLSAHS